jgi:hypothetical protein
MCDAGVEGQEWVDLVIMGKKTPSQCGKHFGMTVNEVMSHVYEHTILGIVPEDAAAPAPLGEHGGGSGAIISSNPAGTAIGQSSFDGLISLDFYSNEIMQILAHLKKWSRALSIHQSSSTKDIDTGLKVMRELRLTVESLAEFQGRLASKSHTTINVDSINMKYMSMTNVIRTELCPTCRQKMLAAISEETQPQIQTITPEIISNISRR